MGEGLGDIGDGHRLSGTNNGINRLLGGPELFGSIPVFGAVRSRVTEPFAEGAVRVAHGSPRRDWYGPRPGGRRWMWFNR